MTIGRAAALLGALLGVGSGCGDNGDDDPAGGGEPPRVEATVPAANGCAASAYPAGVRAVFSTAMDPATITRQTFVMSDHVGIPIDGAVTYDEATRAATFVPTAGFGHDGFRAMITEGATDLAGNPLAVAHTWQFTPSRESFVGYPALAVRGERGLAVWWQDSPRAEAWASWYAGGVWSPPAVVFPLEGLAFNSTPRVAIDAAGNAMLTWWDGWPRARRYDVVTGWGPAEAIGSPKGTFEVPRVVFDAAGNAVAFWRTAPPGTVWTNRYVRGEGWRIPEPLTAPSIEAWDLQVAGNDAGEVVVVWVQYDGEMPPVVVARRFAPASGWGDAVRLDPPAHELAPSWLSAVTVAPDGRASAFWIVSSDPPTLAHARGDAAGWSAPEVVAAGLIGYTEAAADDQGNVVVAWQEDRAVRARRRTAAGRWEEPVPIDDATGAANLAGLRVGAGGDAVISWHDGDDVTEVRIRPYRAGAGWDASQRLGTATFHSRFDSFSQVGLDAARRAVVVWRTAIDMPVISTLIVGVAVDPDGSAPVPVLISPACN